MTNPNRLTIRTHDAELTLERRPGGVLLVVEEETRLNSSAGMHALARDPVQMMRAMSGQRPNLPRRETQHQMIHSLRDVQARAPFPLNSRQQSEVEAFLTRHGEALHPGSPHASGRKNQ